MKYNFYVSTDSGKGRDVKYNDDQVADAMAAWSKAISDGDEYVYLEALRQAGT